MNRDILTVIQENMSTFSKGQKTIANYLLHNYDKAAYLTAARLGKEVGVSESTVVRFAVELGYEGYPEMQKNLQELVRNLHRDAGKRRTVIFVTHDIDEALYLGTRLVVFSSSPGRIIADEENRISRRYDRTALFRQPEIKALQQKIPAAYRSDMLERLAKRSEVRNGGGI